MRDQKTISIVVCLLLVFYTCVPTVLASSSYEDSVAGYKITEIIGENKEVIRIYEKEISPVLVYNTETTSNRNDTKELLFVIGMNQHAIENLSEESLNAIAQSDKLMMCITYTKYDIDGKVTHLDEETALAETSAILDVRMGCNTQTSYTSNTTAWDYTGEAGDSYLKVTYLVAYEGDAKYNFYIDA